MILRDLRGFKMISEDFRIYQEISGDLKKFNRFNRISQEFKGI